MNWYKNKLLNKMFLTTTDWNVAWKNQKEEKYNIIKNPLGYWLADSLLFEDNNENYLFVEAFEKKENIGRIAVMEYNKKNNNFQNFKVIIKEEYHLSYPYVFKYKNQFYMIPETNQNNDIELYISEKFPHKWKKIKQLLTGKYVDTTLEKISEDEFKFYTYNIEKKEQIIGILNMEYKEMIIQKTIKDNDNILRAGGNVFTKNNIRYRALQNNKYFYGQSLNIINLTTDKIDKTILPNDIKTITPLKIRRIHTYSRTKEFEAVDISNYKFNLVKFIKKLRKESK